jgi:hypothetical protein
MYGEGNIYPGSIFAHAYPLHHVQDVGVVSSTVSRAVKFVGIHGMKPDPMSVVADSEIDIILNGLMEQVYGDHGCPTPHTNMLTTKYYCRTD